MKKINAITVKANFSYERFQKMQKAFSEFNDFSFDNFLSVENTQTIYHYTSPEALMNILRNDGIYLRYTKFNCLNDKNERENIKTVYSDLIAELKSQNLYQDRFLAKIKNLDFIDKNYIETIDEQNKKIISEFPKEKFVCCFSKDEDLLGMWRYYVKNKESKGYCIGLSQKSANLDCKRIIYSDSEKKEILNEFIKAIYKLNDVSADINYILNDYLKDISLFFKDKCFSDEKEIRSEINRYKEKSSEKEHPIQFRNSNGTFIPYIEKKFPKEMLKSITLSPLMNMDDERNLRYMLEYLGYNNFEIRKSKLPIRF